MAVQTESLIPNPWKPTKIAQNRIPKNRQNGRISDQTFGGISGGPGGDERVVTCDHLLSAELYSIHAVQRLFPGGPSLSARG